MLGNGEYPASMKRTSPAPRFLCALRALSPPTQWIGMDGYHRTPLEIASLTECPANRAYLYLPSSSELYSVSERELTLIGHPSREMVMSWLLFTFGSWGGYTL